MWENPNAIIKKLSLYKERGENEGGDRLLGSKLEKSFLENWVATELVQF